ncbi:GTPase HflX [Tepidicaulis sp.]|uniref:GTPase HflX n=1 Tax=Tepidicaulis sp. TaxID=1920809 RepID=UPI003B5A4417
MTDHRKLPSSGKKAAVGAQEKARGPAEFQIGPKEPTRAFVIVPWFKAQKDARRKPENRLEEAVGLAAAIDLDIVGREVVMITQARPATLIGTGKLEELGELMSALHVELVVVDGTLTPGQQRNLEKAWKVKVLDRTGLILEIFGARAATREGALQVELAHLTYQKSRLVRSWTHLERQRGGTGFLGGPGETQIEADRRAIQDKINRLEKQLDKVKRTRELHRKGRREAPYPVIALVGYTNAGKSTLFNRLTKASVFAKDLLFATLDPTMRLVDLPSGRKVVLSDTVGFISDLPTHLVAAFRATLEEVLEAEIILHVRDISHEETDAQRADVLDVLKTLGIEQDGERPIIEVLNKADLMEPERRAALLNQTDRQKEVTLISALTGEGVDHLLADLDALLAEQALVVEAALGPEEAEALAWLHQQGVVSGQEMDEDGTNHLVLKLDDVTLGRFRKRFAATAARVLTGIPEREAEEG